LTEQEERERCCVEESQEHTPQSDVPQTNKLAGGAQASEEGGTGPLHSSFPTTTIFPPFSSGFTTQLTLLVWTPLTQEDHGESDHTKGGGEEQEVVGANPTRWFSLS